MWDVGEGKWNCAAGVEGLCCSRSECWKRSERSDGSERFVNAMVCVTAVQVIGTDVYSFSDQDSIVMTAGLGM